MAATGKTPILLYGSTTPTNTPSAGNLTNSSDGCEIAINVADKNLFFKDSTNAVNTVPIRQSSSTSNGWLSSTDWNTFNNKQPAGTYVTSVTGTAPVVSSGGTTPAISMAAANGSTNGYLTSTDWSTFNNKVSSQWVTSGSNIYYTTGTVNIGATDPSYRLDVAAGDTTAGLGYAMRLRTNATAGAASIQFTDNPVSAQLGIITCDTSGNLKFSSSGGQAMQLHASKGVSIGNTTDPGAGKLTVNGQIYVGTATALNSSSTFYSAGGYCLTTAVNTTATPTYHIIFNNPNGAVGSISTGGTVTSFNIASDKRLKNDLGVVTKTNVIDETIIHDFSWIADETVSRGVFAQEAYETLPSAVTKGIDNEDGTIKMPWSVDYSKYIPDLIVYCKALKAELDELKSQIKAV